VTGSLDNLEEVVRSIREQVFTAATAAHGRSDSFPIGFVIARCLPGLPAAVQPRLVVVQEPSSKWMMRTAVRVTHAEGSIYVARCRVHPPQDAGVAGVDAVVIVLEHRHYGNRAWLAPVDAGKLGEFGEIPAEYRVQEDDRREPRQVFDAYARFLPERYLN